MSKLDAGVQKPISGINVDISPLNQPEGSYRFALNAVNQSSIGDMNTLITEESNELFKNMTVDIGVDPTKGLKSFIVIGNIYIGDEEHAIFGVTSTSSKSFVGILGKELKIFLFDDDNSCLKFDPHHQITGEYRLRNGCEKTIYWVDGVNKVKTLNFTEEYLDTSGNINCLKLQLLKHSATFPTFESVKVVTGGALRSGTYNFAIKYVDDNGNDTEWLAVSQLVSIYKSSTVGANYDGITGSINAVENSKDVVNLSFGSTLVNKRIELTLGNLNLDYPYYRIAIIEASASLGTVSQVLESTNQLTKNNIFVHDGNDSRYTETAIETIIPNMPDIGVAQHIEQLEDRLILANTESDGKDYCNLQKFASLVTSEYVVNDIETYDPTELGDAKNPESYFEKINYMGGEVYAFGIVYIFKDGVQSPAYHIPGRPSDDDDLTPIGPDNRTRHLGDDAYPTWRVVDTASGSFIRQDGGHKMAFWEMQIGEYEDRKNCEGDGYWGVNGYNGAPLLGTKIRHHKFPNRITIPHHTSAGQAIEPTNSIIIVDASFFFFHLDPTVATGYTICYKIGDVSGHVSKSFTVEDQKIDAGNISTFIIEGLVDEVTVAADCGGIPNNMYANLKYYEITNKNNGETSGSNSASGDSTFGLTITFENQETYTNYGILSLLGINFKNIQLPPDAVGYKIVRAKRDEYNRVVLAKGFSGLTRKSSNYIGFSRLIEPYCHYTNVNPPENDFDSFNKFVFTPESVFENKDPEPTFVKVERTYRIKTTRSEGITTDIYNDINDESSGFIFDGDGSDWVGTFSYNRVSPKNYPEITQDRNIQVLDTNYLLYVSSKGGYNSGTGTRKLYNGSLDNKIGIIRCRNEYLATGNEQTNADGDIKRYRATKDIYYISLLVDKDIHPVLDNIEYYQTKNNIQTASEDENFGGDTFISHFHLTSTTYQGEVKGERALDFAAKTFIIIIGVIVGILGAIFTGGAVTVIVAIGIAAILVSGAASIITAGYEEFFNDYKLNKLDELLFDCSVDHVKNEVDDTFYNSMDHIYGMFVESDINVALRQPTNTATPGMIKAHTNAAVKQYMVTKCLSWSDEDVAYKYYMVVAPELYKVNKDYSRMNQEKVWFSLPSTYDCCSNCREKFPNRIYYSEKSFVEERFDSFSKFKALNYTIVPGEHGEITNIFCIGNAFFAHTKSNLWYIPANIQERITGDVVSLIGTGGFFGADIRKIVDSDIGSAGSDQKFATIKTPIGVFFIDKNEGVVYVLTFSGQAGTKLTNLSEKGMNKWFKKNSRFEIEKQIYEKTGEIYIPNSDPVHRDGIGYTSTFDYFNNRFILTKKEIVLTDKGIDKLIVINDLSMKQGSECCNDGECSSTTHEPDLVLNLATNIFYTTWCVPGENVVKLKRFTALLLDSNHFFRKSGWTISFSNGWTSFHSYIPNMYINNNNKFFSILNDKYEIWLHNVKDSYLNFYGEQKPHIIDLIGFKNPVETSIYDNIMLQTNAYKGNVEQRYTTFNKIVIYNDRQSTGELDLKVLENAPTENYMMDNLVNIPTRLIIKKVNKDWRINGFKDLVININEPLFKTDWDSIKDNYFIDKVVNTDIIDINKDWNQQERFKDKYLGIRLIFDNKTNTKLVTNYVIESEQSTNS